MALQHSDGFLRGHHVPQAVTAHNDIAVPPEVQRHYTGVWLWTHNKLATVEVITPQVTCAQVGFEQISYVILTQDISQYFVI